MRVVFDYFALAPTLLLLCRLLLIAVFFGLWLVVSQTLISVLFLLAISFVFCGLQFTVSSAVPVCSENDIALFCNWILTDSFHTF